MGASLWTETSCFSCASPQVMCSPIFQQIYVNPVFRMMGQGREYMESSCIRNLPQNSLIPMQFSNFN